MGQVHLNIRANPEKNLSQWEQIVNAEKFTGTFDARDISGSRENFKAHFLARIESVLVAKAGGETGLGAARTKALEQARATIHSISDYSFDTSASKLNSAVFRKMIVASNIRGSQVMDALESRLRTLSANKADIRPQLIEHNGKLIVIRKAPAIENLAMAGGGTKGMVNSTVLEEMTDAGLLDGLKRVAGSSAGAITAAVFAAGVDPAGIRKITDDMPARKMVKTSSNFAEKYPMYSGSGFSFKGKGGNIIETVDHGSAKSVAQFLRDGGLDRIIDSHPDLSQQQIERLQELADCANDLQSDRSGKMVTFADLKLLHQVAPERFKELTITGTDFKTRKTVYFNADTTPDLPIAMAARISGGLPGVFQKIKLEIDGKLRTLVDGGISSNMPAEAFVGRKLYDVLHRAGAESVDGRASLGAVKVFAEEVSREEEEVRARTALLTFSCEDTGINAKLKKGSQVDSSEDTGINAKLEKGSQDDSSEDTGINAKRKKNSLVEKGAHRILHNIGPDSAPDSGMGRVAAFFVKNLINGMPSETALKGDEHSIHRAGPNTFVAYHGGLTTINFDSSDEEVMDANLDARKEIREQIEARVNQAVHHEVKSLEEVAGLLSVAERNAILDGGRPEGPEYNEFDRRLFDLLHAEANEEADDALRLENGFETSPVAPTKEQLAIREHCMEVLSHVTEQLESSFFRELEKIMQEHPGMAGDRAAVAVSEFQVLKEGLTNNIIDEIARAEGEEEEPDFERLNELHNAARDEAQRLLRDAVLELELDDFLHKRIWSAV